LAPLREIHISSVYFRFRAFARGFAATQSRARPIVSRTRSSSAAA
jgi:hypothetical protein